MVKNEDFDLLIPVTDFTAIPLIENKKEVEEYVKVAAPNHDVAMKAFDKAQTMKIAAKQGIPHPKTLVINDPSEVKEMADELDYPVVIKPRTSIVWVDDQAIKLKVTHRNYAYSKSDLVIKYQKIKTKLENSSSREMLPVVQEYVEGTGFGVEALICNSKPVAVFAHKRLREYPITGGASTLRVGIRNKKLVSLSLKMLNSMNWEGIAMVEFRADEKIENIHLLEVNGRFWGSLSLAIASGVDFPYLLYKSSVNEDTSSMHGYKVGIKRKWIVPGEILWLSSSIISGKGVTTSLFKILETFDVPDDIFMVPDPLPIFGALKTTFQDFLNVLSHRYNAVGEIENPP